MRIKTNSNTELVAEIKNKLSENGGYCPCRIQKSEDTKCMCKEFRTMMDNKETGYCHCGLYKIEQD